MIFEKLCCRSPRWLGTLAVLLVAGSGTDAAGQSESVSGGVLATTHASCVMCHTAQGDMFTSGTEEDLFRRSGRDRPDR